MNNEMEFITWLQKVYLYNLTQYSDDHGKYLAGTDKIAMIVFTRTGDEAKIKGSDKSLVNY